jgi:DNA polymerase (family 10)
MDQRKAPAKKKFKRARREKKGGLIPSLGETFKCPRSVRRRSQSFCANTRSGPRCAAVVHIGPRPTPGRPDSLAALVMPLDRLIAEDRLPEIPGVGEAIADIITKLHRTGTHPSLEKLRKEVPAGVLEMLAVPGLRPDKVLRLYKDLGITSLAELEAAAKDDRLKKAKGLGASLQSKILQNLAIARSGEGRLHLHRAAALLDHAKETLERTQPDLRCVTVAGDLRRGCELVAELCLVAEASRLDGGPTELDSSGLKIHLTDRKHFGAALLHATGSSEHLDQLRSRGA